MKRVLLVLSILAGPAWAHRGGVQNIPPREYFETVRREINGAKSSIALHMYLFSLQPNESKSELFMLALALRRARDRGVKVGVVLDQNKEAIRLS